MVEEGTIFRARLEQVGEGIYRAFYQHDAGIAEPNMDTGARGHVTPDMHTGTDPDSVRQFVESLAKNQGYDRVEWEPYGGLQPTIKKKFFFEKKNQKTFANFTQHRRHIR